MTISAVSHQYGQEGHAIHLCLAHIVTSNVQDCWAKVDIGYQHLTIMKLNQIIEPTKETSFH